MVQSASAMTAGPRTGPRGRVAAGAAMSTGESAWAAGPQRHHLDR